ncbi:beta-lactamase family protein [Lophiotrema nucula]|uniref:Beta-lactamase family protein n=1 Tax=Lophiotrema nucula TaxID=690887 RepID=A0A6A5YIT6_9PLEO|nr:beta-lactamase family protein [Lophiotrema nucula]
MEQFEEAFEKAMARGSDGVPGAAVAVVNQEGNYVYQNVKGHDGVHNGATALNFDRTFFLASCTKLITSIAALQTVERDLIRLDDPLDEHLPELTTQPIIVGGVDATFEWKQATKSITLRHLLSHSSGAVYDFMDSALTAWRQSREETPTVSQSGIVAKDYAMPRTFEAGEGWMYGTSLDWAGLLVARLNSMSLEQYVEENISIPLGMTSFTWHLSRKPHVEGNLVRMSVRGEDGKLSAGTHPPFPEPVEEGGGAGLYANVHDYTRVLADLLKDSPILLKKTSVDMLFAPQFEEGGAGLSALYANSEMTYKPMVGQSIDGIVINHGLGGLLVQEDIQRETYFKPKGTLTWSGLPNLLWSINRERGLALMFAVQVIPWNDKEVQSLSAQFETAVWRHLSR